MHVVFEVTNYKRVICVLNTCTLCNGEELPKGHNHNICPRAECQTCKLFGHVANDCVYANCLDVDVDWFNLLFTKSESTVQAYFAEVSVQAISLRTDGIVRTVTSWDLLQDKFTLSANQLPRTPIPATTWTRSARPSSRPRSAHAPRRSSTPSLLTSTPRRPRPTCCRRRRSHLHPRVRRPRRGTCVS
jgi:hypothetical protein